MQIIRNVYYCIVNICFFQFKCYIENLKCYYLIGLKISGFFKIKKVKKVKDNLWNDEDIYREMWVGLFEWRLIDCNIYFMFVIGLII